METHEARDLPGALGLTLLCRQDAGFADVYERVRAGLTNPPDAMSLAQHVLKDGRKIITVGPAVADAPELVAAFVRDALRRDPRSDIALRCAFPESPRHMGCIYPLFEVEAGETTLCVATGDTALDACKESTQKIWSMFVLLQDVFRTTIEYKTPLNRSSEDVS